MSPKKRDRACRRLEPPFQPSQRRVKEMGRGLANLQVKSKLPLFDKLIEVVWISAPLSLDVAYEDEPGNRDSGCSQSTQ